MYANAELIARTTLVGLYTPPERLTVDRWVEKHRVHSEEGASGNARGDWDCSLTPYLIGLLRAHTDPEPREIALWKSTQVGATDGWLYNCTLFDAHHGLSQMLVYPTQSKGQDKNRRALVPAFKSTAPFANITSESKLTADELRLSSGTLVWFGYTGSRDSLRGDPCGFIKCDEIDAYDASREDPLENCRSRARTYGDSKIEKTSTPMGDTTGVTKEYDDADVKHQYHCPCPECGQFFEPWDFELLGWMGGAGGVDVDPKKAAANCWLSCPHCSSKIREQSKRWMVQHGLWITSSQNGSETIDSDGSITKTLDPATHRRIESAPMLCRLTTDFFRDEIGQPDALMRDQGMDPGDAEALRQTLGIRITGERQHGPNWGFRINTLASLIAKEGWGGLVYAFVKNKGKPNATWWRDNLGQSPTKTAKSIEVSNLMRLCAARHLGGHEHGQCPSWTAACFGGVDIQKDCIKAAVWAFSPMMHRAALVLSKRIERQEELKLTDPRLVDWLEDILINSGLPVQDETLMGGMLDRRVYPMMAMDTGYWKEDAYALVDTLQRRGAQILPCRGESTEHEKPRPFWLSDVRHNKIQSGERVGDSDPTLLVMVNGPSLKNEISLRMIPHSDELLEAMIDEDGHQVLPDYRAVELPGQRGWVDDDGHSMAASVLGELSAEHKILIGAGSGRSGQDGRGALREVWRKVKEHRKNDYFDATVYAWCMARYAQMDRYSYEDFEQHLAQLNGESVQSGRRVVGSASIRER